MATSIRFEPNEEFDSDYHFGVLYDRCVEVLGDPKVEKISLRRDGKKSYALSKFFDKEKLLFEFDSRGPSPSTYFIRGGWGVPPVLDTKLFLTYCWDVLAKIEQRKQNEEVRE